MQDNYYIRMAGNVLYVLLTGLTIFELFKSMIYVDYAFVICIILLGIITLIEKIQQREIFLIIVVVGIIIFAAVSLYYLIADFTFFSDRHMFFFVAGTVSFILLFIIKVLDEID